MRNIDFEAHNFYEEFTLRETKESELQTGGVYFAMLSRISVSRIHAYTLVQSIRTEVQQSIRTEVQQSIRTTVYWLWQKEQMYLKKLKLYMEGGNSIH